MLSNVDFKYSKDKVVDYFDSVDKVEPQEMYIVTYNDKTICDGELFGFYHQARQSFYLTVCSILFWDFRDLCFAECGEFKQDIVHSKSRDYGRKVVNELLDSGVCKITKVHV